MDPNQEPVIFRPKFGPAVVKLRKIVHPDCMLHADTQLATVKSGLIPRRFTAIAFISSFGEAGLFFITGNSLPSQGQFTTSESIQMYFQPW